jgi:hypothetical protein
MPPCTLSTTIIKNKQTKKPAEWRKWKKALIKCLANGTPKKISK